MTCSVHTNTIAMKNISWFFILILCSCSNKTTAPKNISDNDVYIQYPKEYQKEIDNSIMSKRIILDKDKLPVYLPKDSLK